MTGIFLVLATFLASAVEAVEALTIVLALGVTRGWPSVRLGIAAAVAALAVLVALLGPGLRMIPIDALRLVVGAFLLVFGMQWLRKAILRAAGYKALHDEDEAYRRQVHDALAAGAAPHTGVDWYSFVVSFKGVFLEGVEVVFIVLTFGSAHGSLPLAIGGAAATRATDRLPLFPQTSITMSQISITLTTPWQVIASISPLIRPGTAIRAMARMLNSSVRIGRSIII